LPPSSPSLPCQRKQRWPTRAPTHADRSTTAAAWRPSCCIRHAAMRNCRPASASASRPAASRANAMRVIAAVRSRTRVRCVRPSICAGLLKAGCRPKCAGPRTRCTVLGSAGSVVLAGSITAGDNDRRSFHYRRCILPVAKTRARMINAIEQRVGGALWARSAPLNQYPGCDFGERIGCRISSCPSPMPASSGVCRS
jgi:hypothetical protein